MRCKNVLQNGKFKLCNASRSQNWKQYTCFPLILGETLYQPWLLLLLAKRLFHTNWTKLICLQWKPRTPHKLPCLIPDFSRTYTIQIWDVFRYIKFMTLRILFVRIKLLLFFRTLELHNLLSGKIFKLCKKQKYISGQWALLDAWSSLMNAFERYSSQHNDTKKELINIVAVY